MDWGFDNTFVRDLGWLGALTDPVPVAAPRLVLLNEPLAHDLSLDPAVLRSPEGVAALVGNHVPPGAQPMAQAYSGHQFGQFSPVLGDGRAHLLGELIDVHGERRDLALKGSGRTPFSRGGDGRAALGPVLREYLFGEAMHALGVPTTRALAAVATGEVVHRERPAQGAVLVRVAGSHLRVGTVELVRAHGSREQLAELVEYVRARHYPQVDPGHVLDVFSAMVERQAELVAQWMSLGFVHGVMNTDNTSLSGETIDYGPCAWLDAYEPDTWFSSIDHGGRYRFGAQPQIAMWNLARLAEALVALADGEPEDVVAQASERLHEFTPIHQRRFEHLIQAKIALPQDVPPEVAAEVQAGLLTTMRTHRLDWTSSFRALATRARGGALPISMATLEPWIERWLSLLPDPGAAADQMDRVNPIYVPRNHLVEEALEAAQSGDLVPFESLLARLSDPFTFAPGAQRYAEPAPDEFTEGFVTYCGT